jgi:hypothetical protein
MVVAHNDCRIRRLWPWAFPCIEASLRWRSPAGKRPPTLAKRRAQQYGSACRDSIHAASRQVCIIDV